MNLKQFRVNVNVIYKNKLDGIAGFLQAFGVTAKYLDEAVAQVVSHVKNMNIQISYTICIKNAYESDLNDLLSISNFIKMKNPRLNGIWFYSGIIKYKEKWYK